ncbi:histidine phosphatase family protein [Gulosibacter sp. 10]|uniref:SixA phosphatase family protein n=1 Tax=Gulosibacter sp. 10 TaxID=1255570 RepID=UPI000B35EF88|nr:histidine phosphatase family protein [Gulosibacter sp. 10]
MQRTLYVMRHAKSSWQTGEADHERPLNERGRRDALVAGEYFASLPQPLDRVLSSSARRTRQTWSRILDGGAEAGTVTYHDEIYESSPADVLPLLRNLDADIRSSLVIGHFPCVSLLVRALATPDEHPGWNAIDHNYPTAAISAIAFDADWTDLDEGIGRLDDFVVPRAEGSPNFD